MSDSKFNKISHRIKLLGQTWRLRFVKYPELGTGADGACDPPETSGKQIRVNAAAEPERIHEVIIHECLHGAFWWLDEEFVTKFAADLSEVLLRPEIRSRWDRR